MKPLFIGIFCLLVSGIARAAGPILPASTTRPSAPMVTCTITMNYWCIVQADAGLNMTDAGAYRIWKMIAPDSKREVVTVRENKSCDSPSDLRPRKKFEGDERSASGERWHAVEIAMSADGACALKVEYLAGNTDWAREALQLATYRLYLCNNGSCNQPLLEVIRDRAPGNSPARHH